MHYARRPYPWLPPELSQQVEKYVVDKFLALTDKDRDAARARLRQRLTEF